MMRGRLLQTTMSQQGRGDTITLAHPEGWYMQIHGSTRHEPNQSGEFESGSKMRHFTTHSHTSNLQGCSRLHVDIATEPVSQEAIRNCCSYKCSEPKMKPNKKLSPSIYVSHQRCQETCRARRRKACARELPRVCGR